MGRKLKNASKGPSRRQFIASGSALLAAAAGSSIGLADGTSASDQDISKQNQSNKSEHGNALYQGPIPSAVEPPRLWKGSWITSHDAPFKAASVLHFRKEFDLDIKPSNFLIDVSADNQYLLKVNGEFIGTGPSRSDVRHWKYTTYDIARLLRPGKNLIATTVWNFGENAPVRQMSNRTGFFLEGDAANPVEIYTDDSWSVAMESGFSALAMPIIQQHFYYVASPPEKLDARSFRWEWDDPAATASADNGWQPAEVIGRAASRGMMFAQAEWQLMHDGLPLMERREVSPGKVVRLKGIASAADFPAGALVIPANQQASILLDVGHLMTGYPDLAFSKGSGAEIKLTYAEALYDAQGKKGNRNDIKGKHIDGVYDLIYPDGSSQRRFTSLDWRTWRYMQIDVKTADEPLHLDGLQTWFTAFPFKKIAEFKADDAVLSSIMEVGYRTARLCAHDTYMDTPYWERLQYIGDTRVQALITYVMTGDNRLPREAIQAFHNSAISDGITLSRYPTSVFQAIPGFSLFWIGMVHDFWMYNDDPEFVQSQLPLVRSTLSWFADKQNKNGLMGRLPWWPFVDWSNDFTAGIPPQEANGDSTILSLQFVEALRYASAMERTLGLNDLAQRDTEQADFISAAVRSLCWSDQYGLLADTPQKNHFSQQANAFGVWLDVIPRCDQKSVMNKILSVNNPGFSAENVSPRMSLASYYFRFYLARALVHAGLGDRYLDTLGPWKQMLAEGLTTWAETPPPTRSDSHAWSAHPNYDLLTTVAGISPASPGFKSIRIEPRPGDLKHLHAALPTPKGLVTVVLDLNGANPNATVTLPDGLDGTFIWEGKTYPLSVGKRQISL